MKGGDEAQVGSAGRGRLAFRVLVFLLLGVIVNVAVAWGCSVWSDRGSRGELMWFHTWNCFPANESDQIWLARRGWHPVRYQNVVMIAACHRKTAFGLTREAFRPKAASTEVENWMFGSRPPSEMIAARYYAGWPIHCLNCEQTPPRTTWPNTSPWRFAVCVVHVPATTVPLLGTTDPRPLAYLPIWPGFAINTIFYALALWMLFAVPFVVRRRRRIKRGLCVNCAYDLRGAAHAVCPECGNPVTLEPVQPASSP